LGAKVIRTEILVGIGLFFLTAQLFTSVSVGQMVGRLLFLLLAAVLSLMLIRSVIVEVERREELQKMDKELRAFNQRLQELDKQKTEFLSIASHQLRTPLSIIKGYISMALEGDYGQISSAALQALHNVYNSNEHLVHLVDDFLDVTRMETGRIEFNFQPTDLGKLVTEVAGELKIGAEIKKLKFITEIAKAPPIKIDSERIRHVIFNFIDNAIKYTEKGVITVKLAKEKNPPAVVLTVTDTGLGLDESDRKNLFQKFYRGQNVKATNVNGTGLGLFVCRKFIEVHQGEIWAVSPGLGQGSTFGFRLFLDRR
jgi:signal transduction histidine kinase